MRNKAPWKCYNGNDIYEGDTILHPSGESGVVVYYEGRTYLNDSWYVRYGEEEYSESRLCLQIRESGMGIVRNPTIKPRGGLTKLDTDIIAANLEPGTITMSLDDGRLEMVKFCPNGDIFVKGNLVENDIEVVEGIREFLKESK